MAVHFHHTAAGSNASLLSIWMPNLHATLIAAGWTIEYADSDAIGGGSAGTPAWDKSPVISTDAGVAVYRMPANGAFTRWYVRLRPGWGGNIVRPYMRGITLGATHNGTGGVSGSEWTAGTRVEATASMETAIAAFEDGFFLTLNPAVVVSVERARLPTDDIQDEMTVMNRHGSAAAGIVGTSGETSFAAEFNLAPYDPGTSTGLAGQTLHSDFLDGPVIVGPYRLLGTPFLDLPRLYRVVYTGTDFSVGATIEMNVDGGLADYRLLNSTIVNTLGVFAVATE